MRRIILLLLSVVLAALVAARGRLPSPAAEAMGTRTWDGQAYNVLDLELSPPAETAGSALIAEMSSYFLSCEPTAKHAYTGLLAGRDLILLLAENWHPDSLDLAGTPALYRLWQEGVRFGEVYAPDWYQGREGREFALLSGMTPTNVRDLPSMTFLEENGGSLPFALAASLSRAGYTCLACPDGPGREGAYIALGFSEVCPGVPPEEQMRQLEGEGPFFIYGVLTDGDGEPALERLWQALEEEGRAQSTAVCLVTGGTEPLRGGLFLWARGLEGTVVPAPCSELDVTATLLDLAGAGYDARFLAGRDLLADGAGGGPSPPVSLYGSAWSDWVSDAGSYLSAEDAFFPAAGQGEDRSWVRQARQQVYDQYVFSRRVLEVDYFRQVLEQ